MKIISIVGTRPNFMKLAPLARALAKTEHTHIILHTGQHYDKNMSQSFFTELGIPEPNYNIDSGSGWLTSQLADMLVLIGDILHSECPDLVIVYGDCNSTLAGALSAVQNGYPIMHVEGGIRNNDLLVPETFNRILIDRISSLNLCACQHDLDNIRKDNMKGVFVGDLMKDQFLTDKTESTVNDYCLLTLHRPGNVDDPERLSLILNKIAESGMHIIWPIHPRVYNSIDTKVLPFEVIPPQPYHEMIKLVKGAKIVITDSGGLQKEVYWSYKPCIVILDDTTWPQIRETDNQAFVDDSNIQYLPELITRFRGTNTHPDIFGDGHAADKIVYEIDNFDTRKAFELGGY